MIKIPSRKPAQHIVPPENPGEWKRCLPQVLTLPDGSTLLRDIQAIELELDDLLELLNLAFYLELMGRET